VFALFAVAAKLPAFDVVTAFGHHFLLKRPLPLSIQLKSRAKKSYSSSFPEETYIFIGRPDEP